MFITEKQACTTEFGVGIRYVIFLTDESDEKGYEVSLEAISSDIKKYPWLTGITIAGKEPFDNQEVCLALCKNLPSHMDVMIVTKESYDYIKNTKLFQETTMTPLRESDLDYFIKKHINNKNEEEV